MTIGDQLTQTAATRLAEQQARGPHQSTVAELLGDLPSGSFAFVMATGIVSIAAALADFGWIARFLLMVNIGAFALLCLLTLCGLMLRPAAFIAELRDHRRGPSVLTVVAATNVLGDQIALLTPHQDIAAALWLAGGALWIGLVYCLFAALTITPAKPSLATGLNGAWLLIVVAPQSSAILGAQIARPISSPDLVIYASVSLHLLGSLFYLVIIAFVLYRWLLEPLSPEQFTPSYWITMGAAAITTLAGVRLGIAVATDPPLAAMRAYLIGEAMLFWSVASWWIPLLAGLMLWRHLIRRIRLAYHFDYWSMVFPLAMYAAATFSFAQMIGVEFLNAVPLFFFGAAMAVWCLTFLGMTRRIAGVIPRLLASSAATQTLTKSLGSGTAKDK